MTLLQDYLDSVKHGSLPLAALSPNLFRQATNSVKHSTDNNDMLEFIGDRCVNLACAIIVETMKVCPDQQIFVGRKICDNDTLGRIAWWFHLDKYAALSPEDTHAVQSWRPRRRRDTPPKVLADLFESFVGAYCLERGWPALLSWLTPFFKPLVEIATEDFMQCHRYTCKAPPYVSNWWRHQDTASISQEVYHLLVQFLDYEQRSLASMGRVALEAVPLSTKFIFSSAGELVNDCDRVEVAHHLISQWICSVYVSIFPESRRATANAAHLATVRVLLSNSSVTNSTFRSLRILL
ncbi:hypothetical protein B0H19DRAFT_203243 [Mycena capillaripes]|nr:hypothetical protein B0H19DRAFT_203243 [Mycena capillaripes]